MAIQLSRQASRKDLASAAIFVAIGAYFVIEALRYELGTPLRMGPGFMPILLGSILVLLGLAVAAVAFVRTDEGESEPFAWRGIILVLGTIVFFGATIRGLGFVPVVFLSALFAALSSRENKPLGAAIIAAALTVLCLVIFVIGLGLMVPWFGPWLPF